ncbi:oxoglutarate iron-dependent oxygenase [Colletotrichum tofieldiae]|uniref:Oxoglutarate iron-dependent oxygenase n=1 Tax=Colletotrichum tofieldiae TaxID=708197 RepID=A0A166MJR3_9PEZI|nr:oxoglutarate iron-dependent oxygenase [Colletotrichum tofieldiae]
MGKKPEMASWNGLPVELRGLILEHLAFGAVAERRSRIWKAKSKRHDMGSYAVVCRQWQGFIEKINFSKLEISTAKDLASFDEILQNPARRSYLRRVSLRVELPRYANKLAKIPETDVEQNDNEVAFTQGIWNFFDILSKWTPSGSGIELELSAASPSDKNKYFGEMGLDQDGNSRFFDHDLDFCFITAGCDQIGRHGLPEVSVVSSCQVLRRNHRNFSSRALLTVFSSLPQLREVRFEPWHQVDMEAQLEVDSDHARTLPFWPSHIKRISIFEHFDAFADGGEGEWEDADSGDENETEANNDMAAPGLAMAEAEDAGDVPRTSCPSLGHNLGHLSLQAEEMAVSNVSDVSDFFEGLLSRNRAPPVWKNLRRLALTSNMMIDGADSEPINNVLRTVAKAAKHMPALQILEIYKTDQFGGAVFRYSVETLSTTATWESTWDFRVSKDVKAAWGEVAKRNTPHDLDFLPEMLLGDYRGPYVFFDEHLRTKDLVLHPNSLEDMLSKKMDKCKACNGYCAHPKSAEQIWGSFGDDA